MLVNGAFFRKDVQQQPLLAAPHPIPMRPTPLETGTQHFNKPVKTLDTLLNEHIQKSNGYIKQLQNRNFLLNCIMVVCVIALVVIGCLLPLTFVLLSLIPASGIGLARALEDDDFYEIILIRDHIERIINYEKNPLYNDIKNLEVTANPNMEVVAELIQEIFYYEGVVKNDPTKALNTLSTYLNREDPQIKEHMDTLSKAFDFDKKIKYYEEHQAQLAQKKEQFFKMIGNKG